MANGDVDVTEGSGLKVGTYTISEDAVTRHLQRVSLNSSAGVAVTVTDAAPSASDFGLVVGIHPDSQNANGQATMANSAPVVIASDDPVAVSLALIDDAIKTDDAAFTPATTKVMMAGFQADEASTDSVDEGDAGAARMTLDRKAIVTPQPHTAGGLSIFRSIDLDETEEDIKTSAGQLYGIWVSNMATSTRFVKFYNATAANVTVGTTTPVITIAIPGNSSDDVSGLFSSTMGIVFDTAITAAATTGIADNDTGAPGANEVILNAFYK
jgi:hypothetical protein